MHDFYRHLSTEELRRIDMLEPFDEIEEWQSKCAHYVLLFGLRTSNNVAQRWFEQMNEDFSRTTHSRKDTLDALLPNSQEEPVQHHLRFESYPTSMNYAQRFGHQSVLVDGKHVWTIGGFGTVDGRHRRLKTIEVLNIENGDIQRLDNHSLGKCTRNSLHRRHYVNRHRPSSDDCTDRTIIKSLVRRLYLRKEKVCPSNTQLMPVFA